MKEVRPSTWILLGVLALFIFAPLLLLDLEPGNPAVNSEPAGPDKGIRPSNPLANESQEQSPPKDSPANQPKQPPPTNDGVTPVD